MSFPTFTYSESDSNLDRVRRQINDTVFEEGPLPGDANFSDDEINQMLTAEGTHAGQWQRATAAALEALANAWIRYPTFQGDGIALSRSHIARNYMDRAMQLRRSFGYGSGTMLRTSGVVRVDGYNTDDTPSDEVDN